MAEPRTPTRTPEKIRSLLTAYTDEDVLVDAATLDTMDSASSSQYSFNTSPRSFKDNVSECGSRYGGRRLSGQKKKQLIQMFEKGIDDEGCAAILRVDIDVVTEFKNSKPSSNQPTPDKGLARKEEDSLRQLFSRQVSEGSCADILHIDLDMVMDFKEKFDVEAKIEARLKMMEEASKKSPLAYAFCGAKVFALQAGDYARMHAIALEAISPDIAKDPRFRVSFAAAAAGGTAGVVTGGGTGTVVGGIVGAVVGVGPAFFTFGMSIPISAGIGSIAGLCIGTVTGGTVGVVAGGASGYAGFTYRKEITTFGEGTKALAVEGGQYAKVEGTKLVEKARLASAMLGVTGSLQGLMLQGTAAIAKLQQDKHFDGKI